MSSRRPERAAHPRGEECRKPGSLSSFNEQVVITTLGQERHQARGRKGVGDAHVRTTAQVARIRCLTTSLAAAVQFGRLAGWRSVIEILVPLSSLSHDEVQPILA